MNQEKLKEAGINYEEGVKRFAGKPAMYERFLKKFEADENFAQLKAALDAKDYDAAFRSAHTLKGITGNLSINRFFEKLNVLVEDLRISKTDRAAVLFADLETEYEIILSAIQED